LGSAESNMELNNRELATIIWVGGLLAWTLRFRSVRESFAGVVRAAIQPKILIPVLLAAAYAVVCVVFLATIRIWTLDQAKDTMLWFAFPAIATSFGLIGKWRGESLLRHGIRDMAVIVVGIQFLTSTYTLALPLELILVPLGLLLGAAGAVADGKSEFASAKRVIVALQVGVGLLIVGVAVQQAILDWRSLNDLSTIRSLLLVPTLSLLFIPFTYVLLLYVTYENLFLRLTIPRHSRPELSSYAKKRIVRRFGLRLYSLKAFADTAGRQLLSIRSTEDVDRLLDMPAAPATVDAT
jgi:hypothetical protein